MIDKSKTYRTRDGREVRIYATDGEHGHTIHGAINHEEYGWQFRIWFTNGKYSGNEEHRLDLIEVRPRHKRTVWVSVVKDAYGEFCFSTYKNKKEADHYHYDPRIACIKVELDFEEGQGL